MNKNKRSPRHAAYWPPRAAERHARPARLGRFEREPEPPPAGELGAGGSAFCSGSGPLHPRDTSPQRNRILPVLAGWGRRGIDTSAEQALVK